MKIRIRRHDKGVRLPEYQTPGAVALDCSVREETTIPTHGIAYTPLNISIDPPAGHFVMMAPRSSLHKRGLMFANSVAIFDQDYSGDNDEYKAILYNFTETDVVVSRGDRIGQIMVLPYEKVEWEEVETLGNKDRGGIGSTGH